MKYFSSFFKATSLMWCIMLCLGALMTPGRAELPPSWYYDLQQRAPEAFSIQVQKVTTKAYKQSWGQQIHVTVAARVEQVERTQTNVKAGQTIQIRYLHNRYTKPMAGPSEVPILKRGQKYPAFLEPDKKHYVPAAAGFSFQKVNTPN